MFQALHWARVIQPVRPANQSTNTRIPTNHYFARSTREKKIEKWLKNVIQFYLEIFNYSGIQGCASAREKENIDQTRSKTWE